MISSLDKYTCWVFWRFLTFQQLKWRNSAWRSSIFFHWLFVKLLLNHLENIINKPFIDVTYWLLRQNLFQGCINDRGEQKNGWYWIDTGSLSPESWTDRLLPLRIYVHLHENSHRDSEFREKFLCLLKRNEVPNMRKIISFKKMDSVFSL